MTLPIPRYQDDMVSLFKGDALQLLPEIETASINLIITDPPYWKQKLDYLGKRLEWDRQWPTREAYLAWLRQLAKEWQRVLTPNGSLYCFAAPTMAAHVEVMLEELFEVIQRITWRKPPFATKAEMFVKDDLRQFFPVTEAIIFCEQRHADVMALGESGYAAREQQILRRLFGEYIQKARHRHNLSRQEVSMLVCGSASGACWNWEDGIRMPTEEHFTKLQQIFPACFDREYEALRVDYEALRRPFIVSPHVPYTDVWDFATVSAARGKHACEKPMALMRHMIEVSSRPGDLVLDCCVGSGTTLEAARQCGRKAIGFDMEDTSIDLSMQRLSQQELCFTD